MRVRQKDLACLEGWCGPRAVESDGTCIDLGAEHSSLRAFSTHASDVWMAARRSSCKQLLDFFVVIREFGDMILGVNMVLYGFGLFGGFPVFFAMSDLV